ARFGTQALARAWLPSACPSGNSVRANRIAARTRWVDGTSSLRRHRHAARARCHPGWLLLRRTRAARPEMARPGDSAGRTPRRHRARRTLTHHRRPGRGHGPELPGLGVALVFRVSFLV